eukprot:331564_1
MRIFLLLVLLVWNTSSQSNCDYEVTVAGCTAVTPDSNAPCGCTCEPNPTTQTECVNGGGDTRCFVADCPPATTAVPETPATTCYCPTSAPQSSTSSTTPLPKSKAGKSKGGATGLGVGQCDCSGKLAEIRFVYQGTETNVKIEIFNARDTSTKICEFNNVQPNDEIICNLRGDAPGLVIPANSQSEFENETGFTITYSSGGTCAAQYHTSCSSDIVGIVQPECTELIASGWRDNDGYDQDYDCDDGFIPCDCEGENPPPMEEQSTTFVPNFVDIIVGEECYCSTTDGSTSSTTTTTVPPSKAGKSKDGKSKGGDGLGVGDCNCDGGQADLTLMYQGIDPNEVTVKCQNRKENDADLPSDVSSVATGEEFTCSKGTFEKLGTETLVTLYDSTGEEVCNTQIHTSCSRDIVGTTGADSGSGTWCDSALIVTGWRDNNNFDPTDPTNGQRCDDGYEKCDCENGVYVEEPSDPIEDSKIEIVPGMCICTDQDKDVLEAKWAAYQASTGTTRRRLGSKSKSKAKSKNKENGFGFGNCDCSGGIYLLRFFYKGSDGPVTIQLYNKEKTTLVCEKTDINQGDESYCSLREFPLDSNNDPTMEKFTTDTYFEVTDANNNIICSKDTAKLHTSCSQDIIGWTPYGCDDIIVSGWNDNSGNDCDDGFYPCPCTDCSVYGGEGNIGGGEGRGDECNSQEGSICTYDYDNDECLSVLTANAYKENVVFSMVMVIVGFIIALF